MATAGSQQPFSHRSQVAQPYNTLLSQEGNQGEGKEKKKPHSGCLKITPQNQQNGPAVIITSLQ